MLSVRIIALAYIDLTQMQHDDRYLDWLAGCAERHWSIVHEEEGRERLGDKGWYTGDYIQVRLTKVLQGGWYIARGRMRYKPWLIS